MHLLGHHLADHKLLRIALTSFHGISDYTSSRILARLQINTSLRVSDLTEGQVSSLSAYLSSPSLSSVPETPVGLPGSSRGTAEFVDPKGGRSRVERVDPLDDLKIETDLRRSVRDDLAHHRQVGSYRGRRHAMNLPVRGQNTRNNAQTAKTLNRIDRNNFSTFAQSLVRTFSSPIR